MVARHEREDLRTARVVELDLRIAAEDRDPHDHRLDGAVGGLVEELDVVRPDEDVADRLSVADERHHELARGLVVELARAADLLELAVVDHGDLVGDLHRLVLVVGDEDRRHVDDVVQLAQPLAQLRANASVEGAERLVEQEHLRLGRERAGEAHALPLAARELSRIAVAEALQLDEVQELVDARRRSRPSAACAPSSPKATFSRTVMCLNAA